MKLVSKSIRDRVALIKWRRERVVTGGEGKTEGKVRKIQTQNQLQVPSGPAPHTDLDEPEGEQTTLLCVPTTTATATCKYLLFRVIHRQKKCGYLSL